MSAISTLDDYIDDIANTDTTSYTDADKHASMTRWAHIITEEIIDAQDDWDFQGEIATANLVANQREYTFPTDILKIKRIELKLDGSNWYPANWIDESEIGTSIASESDITENFDNTKPYVALLDKSFFIYSGTITAVTGGIKIWYSEEIVGVDTNGTDITSFSADTDKSNLAEFAQMALVCGAVLDFADRYENVNLAARMNLRLYGNSGGRPADSASMGGLMGRIRNFYSRRIQDKKIVLQPYSGLEDYE
jgi:hypothetical protein